MHVARFIFRFSLTALLLIGTPALAQTKPARDNAQIKQWFKQLDDKDPDMRETARTQLMGIPRERLDDLQDVVRQALPLSPGQAIELRQIVTHVFLTREPYAVMAGQNQQGFLGVQLSYIKLPEVGNDNLGGDNPRNDNLGGVDSGQRVMIESRIPGFGAYPVLRDGDVIERIYVAEGHPVPLRDPNLLTQIVGRLPAGAKVELDVQRAGKIVHLSVQISARPAEPLITGNGKVSEFREQRDSAAEAYWDQTFGKMLNQKTL